MKKHVKLFIGLFVGIIFLLVLSLFIAKKSPHEVNVIKKPTIITEKQLSLKTDINKVSLADSSSINGARVEHMKLEYELLEKNRKKLKKSLAKIKHEIWGLKFPSKKAKEINKIMLNSYELLKNPKMLGAFFNVEEILNEQDKINFSIKSLEFVESAIVEVENNKADKN